MIKVCTCIHEGQDSLHGKYKRVMNETKDPTTVVCTVCKTRYSVSMKDLPVKKKEKK